MLVLTRRVGESIRVGDKIVVTLVQAAAGKVRIGIEAPPETVILREELVDPNPAPPPVVIGAADSTSNAPLARRG
jgi:carbon storage regulator